MAQSDSFRAEGTGVVQTWEVSERLLGEVDVIVRGAGGEDGETGNQSRDVYGDGGDGGSGGLVEVTLDSGWLINNLNSIDVYVADGYWGRFLGGEGGEPGSFSGSYGNGGDGAGSTEIVGDDGTFIAAAYGGGGGGAGGTARGVGNDDTSGGGGGGGARGGSGGPGGSSDYDGEPGEDGEGSGDGGDGGSGGGSSSFEADDGTPGDPGGASFDWDVVETGNVSTGGGRSATTGVVNFTYELAERPSGLQSSADTDSITLTWSDPDWGFEEIEVYRSSSVGVSTSGTPHATVSPGTEEYIDTDVSEGETWYYTIAAADDPTRAAYDGEVYSTIPLAGPINVVASNITADSVDLTWELQSEDEDRVLVESSTDGGDSWTEEKELPPGTEETTVDGLLNGQEYLFRIVAEVD